MTRFCFSLILAVLFTACPKNDDATKPADSQKQHTAVEKPTTEEDKKPTTPAVDLSHPKACDMSAPKCADNAFCDAGLGSCKNKGATGICKPKPEGCTAILLPVCGCDGKTYSNQCAAHKAGVSVLTKGECSN